MCTSEVVFKLGDMYLFQPASMNAFEFEYNLVHVRAFIYILS